MAKPTRVRIEFGAAMATTRASGTSDGETLVLLVYAILVNGAYRGVFSSRAVQARREPLGEHLFEVAPPEGYEGPWDSLRFAEGAGSFYRQSFAQTQELIAESGADVRAGDSLVTDRWVFEFDVTR